MTDHFTIVYFGPILGGFARRMDMLTEVLSTRFGVTRIHSFAALLRFLVSRRLRREGTSVVFYSDLMWPLVALLRCIRPAMRIFYMVRGDQVAWSLHSGRRFRARMAEIFQKLLGKLGCRFVFASDDLHEVFATRFGTIRCASVLPNTVGESLPPIRPFDGKVAVVGDFGTVKNIEHVLDSLEGGNFPVELFGNSSLPEYRRRPWLKAHGQVPDLTADLRSVSLVVLASVSEGFPNVLLDALQAGCGVVVHNEFPFKNLPINENWRFHLRTGAGKSLPEVLEELRAAKLDFRSNNKALIELVESDWSRRVFACLDAGGEQLQVAA